MNESMTIAIVMGSLRRGSYNRLLSQRLITLFPAGFSGHLCEIGDLPLYNQDDDHHQASAVQRLRRDIMAAQGVIFVTPEYNRSIPGVLKNAIDHASRPYGESAWTGKPAGIVGVSEGALGTALAQQHLRNILASLDMPTLALPEIFIRSDGKTFDEVEHQQSRLMPQLKEWVDRYMAWVRLFSARN